jgi:3-oxoacyl-[acyl-carrier-protein] synthase-3
MVIGAETFSNLLDWQDRSTCVLFGDGAGAVVLAADDKPGVLATALHADGAQSSVLSVNARFSGGKGLGVPLVSMDGQAVFKLAVRALEDVAVEVLNAASMKVADLDWFIPHQANIRIIQAVAKRLDVPTERVVITLDRHGNTSAASVPMALNVAVRDGRIRPGQSVLLQGVGGGFTWGAVLLRY